MKKMKQEIDFDKGTLTVKELTEIIRTSTAIAYKLVSTKGFPATRLDSRIKISKVGFNKWINREGQ